MNHQSIRKKQGFPIGALILLILSILGAVNTLPNLQYLGKGYGNLSVIISISVIEVLATLLVSVLMLFKRRGGVLLFPISIIILTCTISFLLGASDISILAPITMWVVIALTILAASFRGFAPLKRGKRILTVVLVITSILYGALSIVNATSVFFVNQVYTETTGNDYSGKSVTDTDVDYLLSQGKQYGFTALTASSESESESESDEKKYYYSGDISGNLVTVVPSGSGEEQTSTGYADSTVIFTPSKNGNFFSSSEGGFFYTDESGNIIYHDKDSVIDYDTRVEYVDSGAYASPVSALISFLCSVVTTGAYIAAILLIKKWLDEGNDGRSEPAYEDEQTEEYEEITEE